jgi:hypothetical protein
MCNADLDALAKPAFVEIEMGECLDLALGWNAAGVAWHSHALSPGCAFNPYSDKYAVVIENDDEHIAYISPSVEFPEVDKQLVKLLHGDDIMDADKTTAAKGDHALSSPLLERVVKIDARGGAWHHHMNFPKCQLSPTPERWTITVESEEGVFTESYTDEPITVLRELEVIYFKRFAPLC